jgi:hypothetical protein
MAIINRSLDSSEQKMVVSAVFNATTTGVSGLPVWRAPFPCLVVGVTATASGVSGSPTSLLKLERFTPGVGFSAVAIAGALTHVAFGTSGAQGFSLVATGSSLLELAAGDQLTITTGGANSACQGLLIEAVVQALQDIKTFA